MDDATRAADANWNAYAACAVDLLPMAVLLLTPTGELLWANHRGQLMLRDEHAIRMNRRAVTSGDDNDATIEKHLARLADDRHHRRDPAVQFFRLIRSDRRSYQAAMMDARALTHEESGAPATLLIIHDPAAAAVFDREAMMHLYGFTRAESALAEKLMTGKNLKEIASETGVSTHTVRAHLKRLFAKTNTTRQAELVLLLGSGVAGLEYVKKRS